LEKIAFKMHLKIIFPLKTKNFNDEKNYEDRLLFKDIKNIHESYDQICQKLLLSTYSGILSKNETTKSYIYHNNNEKNIFTIILTKLNLLKSKFVSEELRCQLTNQSKTFRYNLLAGLIDSDGSKVENLKGSHRYYSFSQCLDHESIILLAQHISRSLGLYSEIYKRSRDCKKLYTGTQNDFVMTIGGSKDLKYISDALALSTKKIPDTLLDKEYRYDSLKIPFAVKLEKMQEFHGFSVKGSNFRFLLHDFTVVSIFFLKKIGT